MEYLHKCNCDALDVAVEIFIDRMKEMKYKRDVDFTVSDNVYQIVKDKMALLIIRKALDTLYAVYFVNYGGGKSLDNVFKECVTERLADVLGALQIEYNMAFCIKIEEETDNDGVSLYEIEKITISTVEECEKNIMDVEDDDAKVFC